MIVACPQCETKFDIPEDKYRPGRKARCSSCGNIFPLPELAVPQNGGQEPPVTEDELFSSLEADIRSPLPEETFGAHSRKISEQSAFDDAFSEQEAEDAPSPVSVDNAVLDSDTEKPGKKRGKKPFFILAFVAVVLLLAAGVFFLQSIFFRPEPSLAPFERIGSQTSRVLDGKGSGEGAEADASRQATVRRLALENVRQYTVTDNPKTGRMVVIEGTVVNNFAAPKDLILLEATIFDQNGNPLVLREQYAGVTLSYIQLTTLPKAALENALNNQSDILTNNTNIPPGGRVPFMTVFFDLPGSAYEFEVKIVDVKDPAPASSPGK